MSCLSSLQLAVLLIKIGNCLLYFIPISSSISQQFYKVVMKIPVIIFIFLLLSATTSILNPACLLCHDIVRTLQKSVKSQPLEMIADQIGTAYCSKKHLQQPQVCKGAVTEMVAIMLPSFWQHHTDPHAICPALKLCSKQYQKRVLKNDVAKILAGKIQKEWEAPTKRKTLKIMHISDLHIDIFYTAGAESKCNQPVCCRVGSVANKTMSQLRSQQQQGKYEEIQNASVKQPAGFWGSLNDCDLPPQTLDLFVKELEAMDLDLIIWTGDNTPHDVWKQSQSYNLNFTLIISQKLKRHTKTRVIAAMGNHQSYPVNVYDYSGDRESMLIGGLAEAWKPWLDQQAYDMLRTKGYFSIQLPQLNNLKIISLNTQAQNNLNFFLLRDSTDPGKMLEWFQKELKDSELKGQFVHIIGHIPPKDFLYEWGERFTALVDRYSYTIRGQFYGHTHHDQAGVFFSSKNSSKLVNFCLVAPSLQCGKHPQYRVMEVDYDTMQVVDFKQYLLNISKFTKKEEKAAFQLFYEFRTAYGLEDMSVQGGFTKFHEMMKNNKATQEQYSYIKSSGLENGRSGKQIYCDLMTSETTQAACLGSAFKLSSFEKAIGGWKDLKHKE